MKGSPMHRNFGVGSPAKNMKTGDYSQDFESPAKQTEENEGTRPEGRRVDKIDDLTAKLEQMKIDLANEDGKYTAESIKKLNKLQDKINRKTNKLNKKTTRKNEKNAPTKMNDDSPLEQKMMETYRKWRRNKAGKGGEKAHAKARATGKEFELQKAKAESHVKAYNEDMKDGSYDGDVSSDWSSGGVSGSWDGITKKDAKKAVRKTKKLANKANRQVKRGNRKINRANKFNQKLIDKHGYTDSSDNYDYDSDPEGRNNDRKGGN